MEKREFPKDDSKDFLSRVKFEDHSGGAGGAGKSKVPGLSNKAFAIIKFLLGLCLLPFVYSISVSFLAEFTFVDGLLQKYFWSGVISFLLVYLFVIEPAKIYQQGQKLLEIVFQFFSPLVKVAPYVLPIYTILIFFLYLVLALFLKSKELIHYFMFVFGFTLALHLVFSAKTMRAKQDFFKASYIFGFSLVYIINLTLVGLFLNLIFEKFSFVSFFNNSAHITSGIFQSVFKQLFGV
ncbi:MAG: hypothetical protein PHN57_02225 [Candidatus Omnitrophica bacterium]|nr:hypothetical protein [Candidatus Omnitrophota bacterium]